jgi:hypothetical protein
LELQPICEESVFVLLRDIAGAARQHHFTEEAFLKANACPTLTSIVTAHSAVQDMLDEMIADVRQQSADLDALAHQISAWVHAHIYETDIHHLPAGHGGGGGGCAPRGHTVASWRPCAGTEGARGERGWGLSDTLSNFCGIYRAPHCSFRHLCGHPRHANSIPCVVTGPPYGCDGKVQLHLVGLYQRNVKI